MVESSKSKPIHPATPPPIIFAGELPATPPCFCDRGLAYVYFTYGNHFMLNVTAELPGTGGGVLIRALEPLEGIEHMQRLRKTTKLRDLTRGPGRLAQAFDIDRRLDGVDLCAPGPLWLAALRPDPTSPNRTGLSKVRHSRPGISIRIGITRAANRLLRFYERNNPFVSGPTRLNR